MGVGLMIYSTKVHFAPAYRKHGKPVPEQRLPPMIVGAIALPIALFWFGWTSAASVHWIVPILASALWAMGAFYLFQAGMK